MQTAETAVPVLDEHTLRELQTLGPEVVAEIFDLFVADVPARLGRLRHALDGRLADAVLREAHALKGSALGVGAARFAHLCAAIEQNAREGHLDGASARSSQLEAEFAGVCDALHQVRR